MTDDFNFASHYALILQGAISTVFGLIGFIQGGPYLSDEVARFYFAAPLALGVGHLLLGIVTSLIIHFRRENVTSKFSRNIGEILLLNGFGVEFIVALSQASSEWFTIALFVPIGLVLLSSMILLLRVDYMNVISSRRNMSKSARNLGVFIIVATLLLDVGWFLGNITGMLSRSTMATLYLNGILFIVLGYLISHYRMKHQVNQSRLREHHFDV